MKTKISGISICVNTEMISDKYVAFATVYRDMDEEGEEYLVSPASYWRALMAQWALLRRMEGKK